MTVYLIKSKSEYTIKENITIRNVTGCKTYFNFNGKIVDYSFNILIRKTLSNKPLYQPDNRRRILKNIFSIGRVNKTQT